MNSPTWLTVESHVGGTGSAGTAKHTPQIYNLCAILYRVYQKKRNKTKLDITGAPLNVERWLICHFVD